MNKYRTFPHPILLLFLANCIYLLSTFIGLTSFISQILIPIHIFLFAILFFLKNWTNKNAQLPFFVLIFLCVIHCIATFLNSTVLPSALYWIGIEFTGALFFLAVSQNKLSVNKIINFLGFTTALVFVMNVLYVLLYQDLSFGFGNINYFMNSVAPVILAWNFWLGYRFFTGDKDTKKSHLSALFSAILLISFAIIWERRGVLLALFMASIVPVFFYLFYNKRRLFYVILITSVLIAIVLLISLFILTPESSSRSDRLLSYPASIQSVANSPIIGSGPYSELQTWQNNISEVTLKLLDKDSSQFHPHNEFINQLQSGGILGFTVFLFLIYLLLKHILRILDKKTQLFSLVLISAIFTHAFTSICYGVPIPYLWALILFGTIFSFKANYSSYFYNISLKPFVLGVFLVSVYIFSSEWTGIYLCSTTDKRLEVMEKSKFISMSSYLYPDTSQRIIQENDLDKMSRLISAYTKRVNWSRNSLSYGVGIYFLQNKLDLSAMLIVKDLEIHLFSIARYDNYINMIKKKPKLLNYLPKALQNRFLFLTGRKKAPKDFLNNKTESIQKGILAFSHITTHMINGGSFDTVDDLLKKLVEKYVFFTAVSELATNAIIENGIENHIWYKDNINMIAKAMRSKYIANDYFSRIKTKDPKTLKILCELVYKMYPKRVDDFIKGINETSSWNIRCSKITYSKQEQDVIQFLGKVKTESKQQNDISLNPSFLLIKESY